MATYGLNDVKNGVKIIVDGDPCTIVEAEFIKPGKGQAFTRIRIRNLLNGRTVEKTPSTPARSSCSPPSSAMLSPCSRRRVST